MTRRGALLALLALLATAMPAHAPAQRSAFGTWSLSGPSGGTGQPDSAAEVMPWDASIYDAITEGAVYIFAEPYVTIVDGRVAAVQNAANPGTRDMVFSETPTPGYGGPQRPTWHADGGLNNRSYASFSGEGEKGVATGFDFDPSDGSNEIAIQVIGRWPNVTNKAGHGVLVLTADNQSWFGTLHLRTDDVFDTWRTNGDLTTPAHNLDYLTPEASNDVGWHLHEGYSLLTGMLAWYDGTQYGPAGTGGPRDGFGALDRVHIGGGSPNGFGSYAACDVHEVVITEGRALSQLAAYRDLRVEPVYGLTIGEPLAVYPSLDLNDAPWHTAAGGWGDQVVLAQVAEPVITEGETEVTTRTGFNSAAAVQGTRIRITGSGWASSAAAGTNITAPDIDVIVEEGAVIDGQVEVQDVPRVRIRGETLGAYGGGLVGQIRSTGNDVADLIIEGLDLNGAADYGTAGEENQAFRITAATRVAIMRNKIVAGGYLFVGDNTHVYFLGNSMLHGAAEDDEVGFVEGWGIRNAGGPITIVDNDIRGSQYVQIRVHSLDSAGEVMLVKDNTIVATGEGRSAWFGPNLGNNTGIWNGVVFEGNQVYAYAAGDSGTSNCTFGPEFSNWQNAYSRGRDNDFFGMGYVVWSQTYLDEIEAGGASHTQYGNVPPSPPGDHDWQTGNTFTNGVSAYPAWGGPGDPSPLLPAGLTFVTGRCDGACDGSSTEGHFDCPGLP